METKTELVWVNRVKMDTGLQIKEHSHLCYQLYYILQGDPVFVVNGTELQLQPHGFFYIPPNTPHRMQPLSGGTLEAYDLKFSIRDAHISAHLPPVPRILTDDRLAEKMLDFIVSNWEYREPQNVVILDNLLSALLACFYLEQLRQENHDDSGSHHIDTSAFNPVTRSIIGYVEKHYAIPHFSLQEMAEALNYNKNYLSTVFSKTTGISIVDYLNLIRIRKAVFVFALHNQDVFTACESSGFTNPSHFSRVFKALVGVSPRRFRYAFSTVDRQSLSRYFTQEPLLNYRICSIEDAYASLRRIGAAAEELARTREKNSALPGS